MRRRMTLRTLAIERITALGVLFPTLWLVLCSAGVAVAQVNPIPDSVVYPTGISPVDANAVQAALNLGGRVLLKAVNTSGVPAAFNFGLPVDGSDWVMFNTDVAVVGETIGTYMTTIVGGNLPFRSGATAVQSSIQGIFFDGPRAAALFIRRTRGTTFVKNRVRNIVGLPIIMGLLKSQAVWSTAGLGVQSGGIVVEDNVIDNSLGDIGYGVALFGIDTTARVARNTIRGANTAGILVGANTQPVVIEDNYVAPGPGLGTGEPFGNGIETPDGLGGSYLIRRNTVICDNPFADGIVLNASAAFGDSPVSGAVVEENDVTMHASLFGGISLYGSAANSLVDRNKIAGDGAYALQLGMLPYSPGDAAEAITFVGNNISRFTSSVADVFFDVNTRDDVLVGNSGSILDLGQGNRITGNGPMGHAQAGQRIAAAQALKQQWMKAMRDLETAGSPDP